MQKEKFDIKKEPIFEQIMHNMVLGQAQMLKKKQRIRIKDAAVLIGVIDLDNAGGAIADADAMLGENEVFCQIEPSSFSLDILDEETRGKFKTQLKKNTGIKDKEVIREVSKENVFGGERSEVQLVEGQVLITKNPCGHPGDIRKVKAIGKDHPAYEHLKHLVNVIVFPTKGDRPLSHQMSTGDLDGDVYMIIWDKRLVEGITKPIPAAYYDKDNKDRDELTEELNKDEMKDSEAICTYFERDTLGQTANLHLCLAI